MENVDTPAHGQPLKAITLAIAMTATVSSAITTSPTAASELMEEILVTAQKREENAQDVPIAISAFSAETISELGVDNISDLTTYTAGLDSNSNSSVQAIYNIRGVQTSDFTVGSDPSVAVYVDGVYMSRGAGAEIPFADVERVEVLKGPQGTLFGRNTTGGALHIITRRPELEAASGEATASLGNYGQRDMDFSYNQPLTDNLALRLSASTNRNDGWQDNLTGPDQKQQDDQTFRAALLWQASDTADILWRTSYSELRQNSGSVNTVTQSVFEHSGRTFDDAFGDIALDSKPEEERDSFDTSVTVNVEFERFTLTAISAYSQFNADFYTDSDGSDNPAFHFHSNQITDQDQMSQEFRLTGESDRLKWTAGLTWSQEHVDQTSISEFNRLTLDTFGAFQSAKAGFVPGIDPDALSDKEIAELLQTSILPAAPPGFYSSGFVLGLASVDPSLLGITLNHDSACAPAAPTTVGASLGVNGQLNTTLSMTCQLALTPGEAMDQTLWLEQARNTGTYKSSAIYGDISYALSDRLNLSAGLRYTYDDKTFTVETGYQNTLFGLPFSVAYYNNGVDAGFIPEKFSDDWSSASGRLVLDYRLNDEVMIYGGISTGFKSGGFNSLNIAPSVPSSFDQEEVTSYEVGLKGDFFEGDVRVNAAAYFYDYKDRQSLDLLTIPGQLVPSYTITTADADIDGFELEALWQATEHLFIGGNLTYINAEATRWDNPDPAVTNVEFADTPPKKVNLMAEYSLPLNDIGQLVLRVDYNWTDQRQTSSTEKDFIVDEFELWNARLAFNSADNNWVIAAWVRNLTDEELTTGSQSAGDSIGSYTVSVQPPRTYGADLTYRF